MHQDIFILVKHKFLKRVNTRDILLIESEAYYSKFTTTTGSYLINATLTQIEADLPADLFCRVHRSYIIPISRIMSIDDDVIQLDNKSIPFGKQYRENLLSRLKIFK